MEPGNGEREYSSKKESSKEDVDKLSSRIFEGIRRRILGETTITYDSSVGRIERDCFLKTPDGDKSLAIAYSHFPLPEQDNKLGWRANVKVIDRTSDSPVGYVVEIDSIFNDAFVEYIPSMSDVRIEDAENTFEATYGLTAYSYTDEEGNFHKGGIPPNEDYQKQINAKENLRRGLLLIEDLLYNANPDAEATRAAREWLEDEPIDDLNKINELLPTIATHINNAMSLLPQAVNDAFTEGDADPHEERI